MTKCPRIINDGDLLSVNCKDEPCSSADRLQKILSTHAVASRREAEKMILDGRVNVNGVKATIGQSALFGRDIITIDGVPLAAQEEKTYVMLNKPCGYVTTVKDEQGRKTVTDLMKDVGVRVYPVGRLDMNTSGLLLLTNDGEFANRMTHPSFEVSKKYKADVRGNVREATEKLKKPIEIDGYLVKAKSVKLVRETENGGTLSIIIGEGRNRQIRKMCTACGLTVRSLKRTSIGKINLGTLKIGTWRHLTKEEVGSYYSIKVGV